MEAGCRESLGLRIGPNAEKDQQKQGVSKVDRGFWVESSGHIYHNEILNLGGLDTALYLKREVNWIMMTNLSTEFRLLIADDNSSFRQTVREVLERRFQDCREALQWLRYLFGLYHPHPPVVLLLATT